MASAYGKRVLLAIIILGLNKRRMKTGITLEDALKKATPGLRYRIEQSVALLRKAERLALMYDGGGIFWPFLAGKILKPCTTSPSLRMCGLRPISLPLPLILRNC